MRISRDQMLLKMAQVAAMRGTCSRAQVGAVIAREGRVLATGYNGAPAGMEHCDHTCTCPPKRTIVHRDFCPSTQPCTIAVHSETNAIAFAARFGVAVEGAELFCTHEPCGTCAKVIINSGIARVVYASEYRSTGGIDLLRSAGLLTEWLPADSMDS